MLGASIHLLFCHLLVDCHVRELLCHEPQGKLLCHARVHYVILYNVEVSSSPFYPFIVLVYSSSL